MFNNIYNKLKDKLIVWIDYSSRGGTIINFINNMPIKLYNNSLFIIYGIDINKRSITKQINKKYINKQFNIYNVIDVIFSTLLGAVIGNSEEYNIRCINKKKISIF